MTTHDTKPIRGEKQWVDFDEVTALWCVFGVDSGFAYSLHACQFDAVTKLKEDKKAHKS